MRINILSITIFVCCSFFSFNVNAQCNPDDEVESWLSWGKSWENFALDYFPMSVEREVEIGDSLYIEMIKDQKLLKSHPKKPMLDRVMSRLTPHVNRKGIVYRTHILDDDEMVNAYAIAGGHVFITSKMLDWVDSEDELAFVLAHEISHVDDKHSLRKVQKILLGGQYFGEYGIMAANIELFLSQPLGQIDEYTADRLGANLMVKAGYDPRKGLEFFEKMAHSEEYNEIEKMIRTHPYSTERHNCLSDYMRNELNR
ncbi:MAG: M48 family metallopeptidase [Chitinophagales bacterium]